MPDKLPEIATATAALETQEKSYWTQTGLNISNVPHAPRFQGTFLQYSNESTTSSLSMTHAQIRIKERYRKKSPNDQKKLAPSIPTEFLGRTRELNLAQSFLLTKPSQYHHSKLEHTEALIEPKVALSDLKYCPTDVQEGEGKSYSYLRSLQKSKPTMAADLRSDAKEFWGKGVPLGSKHPRGALIKNTFWSKALGSTF